MFSGENCEGVSPKLQKKSTARSSVDAYIEVLKERYAKEAELKSEQLILDRERFELERLERQQRLERDAITFKLLTKLIQNKNN